MRFDIAVAAILVAEGLSSSVDAAAQGTPHASDLREIARLRKEAIEAISNRNPNGRREYRMFQRTPQQQQQQQQLRKGGSSREGRNLFEDKIRQFSEDRRLQQFPGTATTITNQQLENKATTGDGPSSHSGVPDLGILPSVLTNAKRNIIKDRIQKLLGAANPQRKKGSSSGDLATSSNNTLPDLGIILSAPTKEHHNDKIPLGSIPSTYHKDYRRLQEGLVKDRTIIANNFCAGLESFDTFNGAATPSCETCQVTYVDDNDPESAYNLELYCPNISQEDASTFGLSQFEYVCSMCQGTCNVDTDNFRVDIKNCSIFNDSKDNGGTFEYPEDNLMAVSAEAITICKQMKFIDTNGDSATPSCETCQVTYVDDNDPESAYNVEIDCPNIPQEYAGTFDLSQFKDVCSYGACQETCNVDKENFLVDMKDCSFSFEVFMDKPIVSTGERFCKQMKSIDTNGDSATPSCETCQVTYVDDNDPESAYNLEIDCPNIPQEYVDDDLLSTISNFENFCSYGGCQTCNVDKENFLVDMKDCSFSIDDLFLGADLKSQPEASGANLNPQPEASGAHSFGKRKTTAGAVLLTMAAVSLVQHATWLNLF